MKRILLVVVLLLTVFSQANAWEECKTDLFQDIVTFMDQVFDIAQLQKNTTLEERESQYIAVTMVLFDNVREKRREQFDWVKFIDAVTQYIKHEELFREPPPGFDPTEYSKNLLMFAKIGAAGEKIHNNLMNFGWSRCKGD